MKRPHRFYPLLFLILPLLAIGAAASGVYWLARSAEPLYDGALRLSGLSAPVRVRFGPHAVPTIEAENPHDLLFAQGFVVAGERLWQMDMLRRLAGGRLAEVFGPEALPADRFFRTLGLDREAKRALEALEPDDRDLLLAHAAGVNAWRTQASRLPLEYRIAGFRPAPWQPEDSLLIGAYMAWTQSFNLREELGFLRLAARLGPERARELFPVDEGMPAPEVAPELAALLASGGDPVVSSVSAPASGLEAAPTQAGLGAATGSAGTMPRAAWPSPAALDAVLDWPARLGLPLPGPASNAWAVAAERTAGGQPLLANDPHLTPSVPGIWYELELIAPGFQVVGAALPGVPLVLIGHNRDLAWGFTTAMADTQDLFVERVSPDGRSVMRPDGRWEPIVAEILRIPVKGGDFDELMVRRTSHGVIVNQVLGDRTGSALDLPDPDSPWLLALRRTNDLPDLAFAGIHRLNRATTLDEARAAILDFRHVVQSLMLAHRDGGIAWRIGGRLPRRGLGNGAFPAPGWVAGYAWSGLEPPERHPGQESPGSGVLIAANHRILPDLEPLVGHAWMAPYRAQRIADRLEGLDPLNPEGMAGIQADRLSPLANLTQAALRAIEMDLWSVDPGAWAIVSSALLDWDGGMRGDSRSAAFFALLEPALFQALYGDELGPDLDMFMDLTSQSYNPLQETLRTGLSGFWDDVATPAVERPAEIWARAIRSAHAEYQARSETPEGDPLAALRTLTFPHAFGRLPLIGRWFEVGPLGIGGSADTVNVSKVSPRRPGVVTVAPSLRTVLTPGDWAASRGTLPLGQSGHLFSPYRTDQLDDWMNGRTHPWPWNGPAGDATLGVLSLEPASR